MVYINISAYLFASIKVISSCQKLAPTWTSDPFDYVIGNLWMKKTSPFLPLAVFFDTVPPIFVYCHHTIDDAGLRCSSFLSGGGGGVVLSDMGEVNYSV